MGPMIHDCFQRPDEGCYLAYTLDKCCSSKQICEPFDNIATCEVNGEIYREGQYISEFNYLGKCLNCICQKNFTGEFVEPFCERKKCNIEVTEDPISDKSAPVYHNNLDPCCPIELIKSSYVTQLLSNSLGNTSRK
ncbi:PREDICTED: uncharacterized protein LOC108559472 [Nicrophorus vespilloides]|uniref:Uncharacterized protein LOC108559472 n=1 Tax=Nicrophorus vespilloides TaxID=110193 RepID=A0ABM1MCG6_NICVS|nr:PREDICTED: uncharacterized protein LOC108559472 [Nicrophorus vespilloides]